MPGAGPDTIRLCLLDVAEGPLCIMGLIRPPAGKFLAAPLTVAATAAGDQQAIASVAEQETLGRGGMGRGQSASCRRDQIYARKFRLTLARRDQVQRREDRDALLKQGLKRSHPRVAMKTARER